MKIIVGADYVPSVRAIIVGKLMKAILFIFLFFSIVLSGEINLKIDSNGNPQLDQFSEEGFVDCVFKISNQVTTDTSYQFHLSAYYDNQILGMDVEVKKNIKAGFDSELNLIRDHVYHKGVIFRRSGEESDRLIRILSILYGLNYENLNMIDQETFTAIALHQGKLDFSSETVNIKIFGNDSKDDNKDDYYESFININMKDGFVFWKEKDVGYRNALINSLSK